MATELHLSTLSGAPDRAAFLREFVALPGRVRRDPYRIGLASPGAAQWLFEAGLTGLRKSWSLQCCRLKKRIAHSAAAAFG